MLFLFCFMSTNVRYFFRSAECLFCKLCGGLQCPAELGGQVGCGEADVSD